MSRDSIDRYVRDRNETKRAIFALDERRAVLLRQLRYPLYPLNHDVIKNLNIDQRIQELCDDFISGAKLAWYCMFIRNADSMWTDDDGLHIRTRLLPKNRIAVMSVPPFSQFPLWHRPTANDCYDFEDIPYDKLLRAYARLRAARVIQRAVREWFWQPKYSNGHVGFHARKGWRDVTDLNEMNREK